MDFVRAAVGASRRLIGSHWGGVYWQWSIQRRGIKCDWRALCNEYYRYSVYSNRIWTTNHIVTSLWTAVCFMWSGRKIRHRSNWSAVDGRPLNRMVIKCPGNWARRTLCDNFIRWEFELHEHLTITLTEGEWLCTSRKIGVYSTGDVLTDGGPRIEVWYGVGPLVTNLIRKNLHVA
jgi:hypothetical protein